ncbi:MAG TPA: GNAT family N-acetyltransferase [Pseudomonadales bacterium]|nr:GNAT family N-acetyltransferase [Pseudomonadales bacterium]
MHPLIRRVEEASLNAWPAMTQLLYDGWVVRMTHGFTRRANSVTPLDAGGARPLLDKIRWCENFYARSRQPTLFRLFDDAPGVHADGAATWGQDGLAAALKERGYAWEERTRVLLTAIDGADAIVALPDDGGARVVFTDRDRWLAAYAQITGAPEASRPLHALILKGIAGDCLHALLEEDGEVLACGLGVVEDDLLGLFDLATKASARRRGHARRLLGALHGRGHALGARSAWLQVVADNDAAEGLYAAFGYRHIYGYRYWRSPA